MTTGRKIKALFAIIFFGGISATAALTGSQAWPFLDYRMYSNVYRLSTHEEFCILGVRKDGSEFPFSDGPLVNPFYRRHALSVALKALYHENDRVKVRAALIGFWQSYNRRRATERTFLAPDFISMRLYRVIWQFRRVAYNFNLPEQRQLLEEIQSPDETP
jgi:hypothetical protein